MTVPAELTPTAAGSAQQQTVFQARESPRLQPCIAHGLDMATGMQHQKMLVDAGQWLLYRFHPERRAL